MSDDRRITRLLASTGRTRTVQYDDGSVELRSGGSVSWRNNNPGNLKFAYAGSADRSDRVTRTREQALRAAQRLYAGVVGLDQWGNAVFETLAAGEAAQLKLLARRFRDRTVDQLVRGYSTADYSGATHYASQVRTVLRTARALGADLIGKTVAQMTDAERHALARGLQAFEGFREGLRVVQPPAP